MECDSLWAVVRSDCDFLVVTREGWTPQPRTARNPVMTGGGVNCRALQCRHCETLGRLKFAPAFGVVVAFFTSFPSQSEKRMN